MQEVTFTLRTLTPLFLAGADQTKEIASDTFPEQFKYAWRLKAELRVPSFRGNMRYWLRALVGGSIGANLDKLAKVNQLETAVFGATDTGSAVRIKVSDVINGKNSLPYQAPRGIRLANGQFKATGNGYLLWSMAETSRKTPHKYRPARWYYPEETEFTLTLSVRDQDETYLKQAIAALWLLTHLDGIGSRARRCAGNLVVQDIQTENTTSSLKKQLEQEKAIVVTLTGGNTSKLSFEKPETAAELKTQIEAGIQSARAIFNVPVPATQSNAKFDVLAPGACRIWILQNKNMKPWPSQKEVMEDMGDSLQNYRGGIGDLKQREIFGLPLGFNQNRRSSPLHLRIAKLQGDNYVGIAVLFKTIGKDVSIDDYRLIEDWANEFSGKVQVTL
jgi:CRISPR-associated protein Cmr1